jgi:hypothetical protein
MAIRKRKIRSLNSDLSYFNRRLFVFQPPIILSRNIAISSGKYEAQIAIFRTFAAVDRFFLDFLESGKLLRKIGKPLRKIVNLKAVTEIRNASKKSESR